MKSPRVWSEWLPGPLASKIKTEEPKSFEAMVACFSQDWERSKSLEWPDCYDRVLEWYPIVNQFLDIKGYFQLDAILQLVSTCMEIGLSAKDDFTILLRFFDPPIILLKKYKKQLSGKLVIPWKSIYDLCIFVCDGQRSLYQGDEIFNAFQDTMTDFIRRARLYFPKGSALEVYNHFIAKLQHTQGNDCYEALGWLVHFLPTSELVDDSVSWNSWFENWLDLAETNNSCDFWNRWWLKLFARMAKDDSKGRVDWKKFMDRLFVSFLPHFQLPVGTSTGDMKPGSSYPSHRASMLFRNSGNSAMQDIPKCIIYLLRNEASQESVILHLEKLVALVEQYYHPSNGGRWTKGLCSFLKSLIKHFMNLLAKKDDENEALPAEIRTRCCNCLLKIASRAQYSKDDSMRLAACRVLCDLSYVSPKTVLPLVYGRFQDALNSITATLTLPTSIHALGICVRPLLLNGLHVEEEFDEKEGAIQAVAQAMMDILPGLDANDTTKTGAVIRFYCAVMFSIPTFDAERAEASGFLALPLDEDSWAEELISRLFILMQNLDAPVHRTDQSHRMEKTASKGTFLMNEYVFFEAFTDLLMMKLSTNVRRRVIKRIADFLVTSAVPCVVQECGQLCSSISEVDPEASVQYLVDPLLEKILPELPPVQDGKPNRLQFSHALETRLVWDMGLVSACLGSLGDVITQKKQILMEVIDRALALTSRDIQSAGLVLLSTLLSCLVGVYPKLDRGPFEKIVTKNGVHKWTSKYPEDFDAPKWHLPKEKEIQLANKLASKYFGGGVQEIVDCIKSPRGDGDDFKDKLIWSLCKIRGVLGGCKEAFVDFVRPKAIECSSDNKGTTNMPVHIAGDFGITIGEPGMRELAAEALADLCACVEDQDPTLLILLLEVMEVMLFLGDSPPPDEFIDFQSPDDDKEILDNFFREPAAVQSVIDADFNRRTRRPFYLILCNLWEQGLQRSVDSAYQKWHSTSIPMVVDSNLVPKSYGRLFGELVKLSLHTYEGVRQTAESIVDKGLIRFPCLTNFYAPIYILSVARCPIPDDLSLSSLAAKPMFLDEVLQQLSVFMKQIEVDLIAINNDVDLGAESKKDAAVDGAVSIMSASHHFFRGAFKDRKRLASMVYALMASRQNTSVDSQNAANIFMWQFLVRFHLPVQMQSADMDQHSLDMCKGLIFLGRDGVLLNWKYTLLANFLLIAMLPFRDEQITLQLLTHFMQATVSKLPALRTISMVGLCSIIQSLEAPDPKIPAIIEAVTAHVSSASFGESFVHMLVHSHVSLQDDDNKGKMARYIKHLMHDGSFEERLVRNASVLINRLGKWPESDSPSSTVDGAFDIPNARTIQAIAKICPAQFLAVLKSPMMLLLQSLKSHDSEHGDQSTLCELLAGVLASGSPWAVSRTQTDWDIWMRDFTQSMLLHAPLEMADAFAVSIRYGVRGLLDLAQKEGSHWLKHIQEIFDVLLSSFSESQGQSSGTIKHLCYLTAALKEIQKMFALVAMPGELAQILTRVVDIIPDLMNTQLQSVRQHVASLMVLICGYLHGQAKDTVNTQQKALVQKSQDVCNLLVERFNEGVEIVKFRIPNKEDYQSDSNTEPRDAMEEGPVQVNDTSVDAKIGLATQFAILGMREAQSNSLQKTLVKLLPGLFQIQDIGDPSLKPLQIEAHTAFVVLKYLDIQLENVDEVVRILTQSSSLDHSHARAAALVYQQVFWFRHCYYLTDDHSQQLQDFVIGRLSDKKLEVQMVASATLSGMLKGMLPEQEEALRHHFMSQLSDLFPKSRRSSKSKSAKQSNGVLQLKHACVLGIRAFITCHPYDIPPWMPEMLTAIVPAAMEPPPIKTTITKTLGEFRLTHQSESHQELRAAFDEEQWEALQGVGSQASYFT